MVERLLARGTGIDIQILHFNKTIRNLSLFLIFFIRHPPPRFIILFTLFRGTKSGSATPQFAQDSFDAGPGNWTRMSTWSFCKD